MARGGTNRSINPAQLHATSGGQLEVFSHALVQPLAEWAQQAWNQDATSDEQAELAVAWTHQLAGRMQRLPGPLQDMAADTILETLRTQRPSGVPRVLRPPVRDVYREMVSYAQQVGWTLPAAMDVRVSEQLARVALDVADADVLRMARMRSATALVAALEGAAETDVPELELLRAHALASAEEAWARTRTGHDAPLSLLEAGRWQIALVDSRSARIRTRRLGPVAASVRHALAEQGIAASSALVTAPDVEWMSALTCDLRRPYAVGRGSMVVLSEAAYRDVLSSGERRVRALRQLATEMILSGDAGSGDSREQRIVHGSQAAHLADRALLDAQLIDVEDLSFGSPWQQTRGRIADALARGTAEQLLAGIPQRSSRTWQAAEANLASAI